MQVNCPKCGFAQPQDQYCAKCGVNMLAFIPVQKPFMQRLVSNTIFQIATFLIVVGAVFAFVRYQQQREVDERIAEIENAPSTQVVQKRAAEPRVAASNETTTASEGSQPPTGAQAEQVAAGAASPFVASAPANDDAPTAVAAFDEASSAAEARNEKAAPANSNPDRPPGAAPTSVRVQFFELQRAALTTLAENSSVRSLGNVTVGIVNGLSQKLRPDMGHSLDSPPPKPIRAQQASTFYSGYPDQTSGEMVGYTVDVTPLQTDENGTNFQVSVWRGMQSPAPAGAPAPVDVMPVPLPEVFTVPRGASLFIAGSLPKPAQPTDGEMYRSHRVFNLLNQPAFRNGITDLVIFIEPQ